MGANLERRLYYISKAPIPDNLRRRIRHFAMSGRITDGPVEIKDIKEFPTHYLVHLVLHNCAEDEMGYHSFEYTGIRFQKRSYSK